MGTDIYFAVYFGPFPGREALHTLLLRRPESAEMLIFSCGFHQQEPIASIVHTRVDVEPAGPGSGSGPEADPLDLVLVFLSSTRCFCLFLLFH